ncbi:sulfate adenylyltransferase subunit 1 [Micromonospora sp. B006]|nr:sulfate adenylyltransferase subunit 1 [Micromonospora sp. B006]
MDNGYELWTNTAPILGPSPGRGSTNRCCRLAVSLPVVVLWSPSSRRERPFRGGSRFYRTALYPPLVLSLRAARLPALARDSRLALPGLAPAPARVPWYEGPSLLHHLERVHIAPLPALRVLTMKLAAVGVRLVAVNLMIDGKFGGGRYEGGGREGRSRRWGPGRLGGRPGHGF